MSDRVIVTNRPVCDIHKYMEGDSTVPAMYDARTNDGRWANVCEAHFVSHTSGQLGTGHGQRLILASEAGK